MKQFKLLTALLLVVALIAIPVLATDETTYEFNRVEVNDITASPNGGNTIYVERGETARVEVYFRGTDVGEDPVDNVRVKAWIGGYEHGDVRDTSDIFEVEPGVEYKKTLRLEMPGDMDANDDYTLHVEIYDDDREIREEYVLRVQEKRHLLSIQDVIFNPGLEVKADHLLISTVRVENLGDKKEEDIKVSMSIPELGLSTRVYIDELVAHECEDDCDDDEEDSASSDELFLTIPEYAKTGLYELIIEVEYDNGHEVLEERYELMVLGGVSAPTEQTTVSVDMTSQELTGEKGAVYKFSIANLGSSTQTYSIEVVGEENFATARVDPSVITVGADQTGELFVFVSALETATEGKHLFTARVMSGNEVVKEVTLEADVADNGTTANFSDVRRGLEIGFVVLLIILVILGIVLVGKKIGKSDSGIEEPMSEEGQSYY